MEFHSPKFEQNAKYIYENRIYIIYISPMKTSLALHDNSALVIFLFIKH